MTGVIKRLSEFGEGFKHHHKNYAVSDISKIRETGGVWETGEFCFHFPEHFGFCYGVDKAIDMVFETCERFEGQRIFLTDQLIHNPTINSKLMEKGVQYLKRDKQNLLVCEELQPGDKVVVSAFGTDFRDIENLKAKGVTIIDSTCGAIINVWKRVEGYAKEGFVTVMHGKRNHEETRATLSQALKEGGSYITIENMNEAKELVSVIRGEIKISDFLARHPTASPADLQLDIRTCKMGMANQTTMLKGESLEIQGILRKAFVDAFGEDAAKQRFRSFDTICGATQDRQDALRKLLQKKLDLILIVGGFNSSNTTHLAEIADESAVDGPVLFHIESAEDILSLEELRARNPKTGKINLEFDWFPKNTHDIGVTSGASTPDVILLEIIQKIISQTRSSV